MCIRQFDVTTAFLNGFIDEEIYMEPPNNLLETLEIIVNSNCDTVIKKRSL